LYYRYKDMRARVNGKTAGDGKSQIWLGMELCDRNDYIEWALVDDNFKALFAQWEAAGFPRRLAPSTHRIDRTRGYSLDNIEFRLHKDKARESLAKGRKKKS
jgi:hypothetical protein